MAIGSSEAGQGQGRRRERALAAGVALLLVAFFAAWHAPGLFGGKAYLAEDTLAYFGPNRAVHHRWVRGEQMGWWDPLPGLGQPRLANIQNGTFSPFTVFFYALPVQTAFRFHAFAVLCATGLATFALFRARRLEPGPAAFGALAWCTMAAVTTHFQHPPVFETLVFLPVALWGWERFLATGRARHAIASGLAIACQAFGASPQYLLYNALVMVVWVADTLWRRRHDREQLRFFAASAVGIGLLGAGLASWQLLPFLELASESHRQLLSDPGTFADHYRASLSAALRALGAELYFAIDRPRIAPDLPYRELPNLSVLTTGLALGGLAIARRPRPWLLAGAAACFWLGTLGSAGGITTLLGQLLPFVDRLRAPVRMIVPAGFLLAFLAALGLQQLPLSRPWRRACAGLACAWVAFVSWTLVRPLDGWGDPARYDVPRAIAEADGRIAVDAWKRPGTPLGAFNAGLAAGVPTLLQREVLIPARFFEGYYASQLGSLRDARRVDRVIEMAALPLLVPDAPLLRSYGLRSIVRWDADGPTVTPVDGALERFRVVHDAQSSPSREGLWRAIHAGRWDPRKSVFLRAPLALPEAAGEPPDEIEVLLDEPDRQRLRVRSGGGILVTSELLFPGWSVQVDGAPAEPLEVDLALRGVVLPPGEHQVEWRYRPTWLPTAAAATGVSGVAALGLGWGCRRRRRRPDGSQPMEEATAG